MCEELRTKKLIMVSVHSAVHVKIKLILTCTETISTLNETQKYDY